MENLEENKKSWQLETLRLTTLFVQHSPPVKELWQRVRGDEPDESSQQRQLASTEQKDIDGYRLTLQQLPGRADWILSPSVTPILDVNASLPTLGDFSSAWSKFSKLILPKWFEFMPVASRLAVAGSAHVEHADSDAARDHLKSILNNIDIGSALEFSLQMNQPHRSNSTSDQWINMIQRWSVLQTVMIQFPAGDAPGSPKPFPVTRIDFDCNNRSDSNRPLESDECPKLVEELTSTLEDLLKTAGAK